MKGHHYHAAHRQTGKAAVRAYVSGGMARHGMKFCMHPTDETLFFRQTI